MLILTVDEEADHNNRVAGCQLERAKSYETLKSCPQGLGQEMGPCEYRSPVERRLGQTGFISSPDKVGRIRLDLGFHTVARGAVTREQEDKMCMEWLDLVPHTNVRLPLLLVSR